MNIYFSGIGGVGIGPLAEIAQDAGYGVRGSDQTPSLITDELAKRGISVCFDQSGTALKDEHSKNPIDWFIYTAALPDDHPELVMAHNLGIKTGKRDELLAEIIRDKNLKLIAIAGTHGKTTTTGMMIWALEQLGVPVSYSVGSTLSFGPSGKFNPHSEFFVYECDEFDRNFLHFHPWTSLITSIDYDHPDTYPTEDDYRQAFRAFITQSEHCVAWRHDLEYINNTVAHGINREEVEQPLQAIRLAGKHNRENAYLVMTTLLGVMGGVSITAIQTALESFPGTGRRFERLADGLYSDYGHHPVEIAATLQMARELSENVVLVYQPHQNVRQHEIKHLYTDCMSLASTIYWLPTYLTRENPELPILLPESLTENLSNKGAVQYSSLNDELWNHITHERENGALVLCMGAGTIDGWVREQLSR